MKGNITYKIGHTKDESHHVWSLSSILTHVAVPVLAIADFFVDDYPLVIRRRHVFYIVAPPAIYTAFVSVLFYMNVDFGRGEPFPYFFFNYNSSVGFLGLAKRLLILWVPFIGLCFLPLSFAVLA